MIPRELLKKIRQITLCTNRVVNEAAASTSLQPSLQFFRVPRIMPEGADDHFGSFPLDHKEDRIWPGYWKSRFAGQPAYQTKAFRIPANNLEEGVQVTGKSLPQPWLSPVVEMNRLDEFLFSFRLNDSPKTHSLARNRFSMSATTSSSGRHSSGCANARSARRSSSATCSGVSSGSNSSRRRSKTWYCSSNGSLWICSRTWSALMAEIYSPETPRQAAFSPSCNTHHATRTARSAFRVPHSAFV